MWINSHKASRLRKKMKPIIGSSQNIQVYSVIPKRVFDQHKDDFLEYKRIGGLWSNDKEVLIGYTGE